MHKVFYISVFIFICVLGLVVACLLMLAGCETPYGTLGADAIDGYIRRSDDRLVCLSDGFDSICVKTVRGPRGRDGRDGRDGKDGRDGAIVTLAVEKVVVETVRAVFIVHVTRTDMTYQTPVGTIYVPEDAPVVVPEGVKVSVVDAPIVDAPIQDTGVGGGDTEIREDSGLETPPTVDADSGEIWHVMYRNNGGVVTVYVYPRCFNNPYHNPPRPECDHGIDEDVFFDVSLGFDNEIQGTQAQVRMILDQALTEDNARLVQVGGTQGIVN